MIINSKLTYSIACCAGWAAQACGSDSTISPPTTTFSLPAGGQSSTGSEAAGGSGESDSEPAVGGRSTNDTATAFPGSGGQEGGGLLEINAGERVAHSRVLEPTTNFNNNAGDNTIEVRLPSTGALNLPQPIRIARGELSPPP